MLKEDWVAPHKCGLRTWEVDSAEKEQFKLNNTGTRNKVTENTGIWYSEAYSNCFGRLKVSNSFINWTRFILKRVYYTAARYSVNLFQWYRNSFLVLFLIIRTKWNFLTRLSYRPMSPLFHHCLRNTLQSQGTTGRKLVSHSNIKGFCLSRAAPARNPSQRSSQLKITFQGARTWKFKHAQKQTWTKLIDVIVLTCIYSITIDFNTREH